MYNFLTAVEPAARTENIRAYRQFLIERDGEVDAQRRTLSRREGQMARFENVSPRHTLDAVLFEQQYAKFDADKQTSKELWLLLTLCKLNAAEAYGVESTFHIAEQRALANAEDDLEMRVLIEEHYHTRILQSSAREYGIEVTHTFQPPWTLRGLIGGVTSVPLELSRPLVLASELIGTLVFAQAFVRAGEILADKPELRDRIQERIVEILIDEIGHVTFNQLQLGPWGMFNARRLFGMVARGMSNLTKEWRLLGINTTTDLSWLERMPQEVMQRAFVLRTTRPFEGTEPSVAAE